MKCPFCDTVMKEWRTFEDEENTANYLKCPKCGFLANFLKPRKVKKV